MNIKNFENHISNTIVNRGYDYYANGKIVDIYEDGDRRYSFTIEGSEDYEVVVHIDNDWNIISSYCNCPYDFGPTCKHEAATYFKLFEILNNKSTDVSTIKQKTSLKEILEGLKKEALIKIIEEIAEDNRSIQKSLIFKYSKSSDEDEIKKCRELAAKILEKNIERYNYELYDNYTGLTDELYILIDKITNIYNIEKNYELAIKIAFEVISEVEKAGEYIEDLDDIYSFNYDVIDTLGQMCYEIKDLDFERREDVFNILIKKVKFNKDTFWGKYTEDILAVLMQFTDIEILRENLKMILKDLIIDEHSEFDIERLSKMLFDILNEYGDKNDSEIFLKEHLYFDTFREIMINRCIANNDFEKVIELACDGERLASHKWDKGEKWKVERYNAYKSLNRTAEQIDLAKVLFLDGNFDYYNELKILYSGREIEIYNELKEKLKNNTYNFNWKIKEVYLKLIVLEKDLDEILIYVRENTSYIEKYAHILVDKYYDEVKEIYINLIKKEADLANSRSRYNTVCQTIKRARKIFEKDINVLIKEFYIKYKRKPAFIDELNKVNIN